MDLSTVFTEMLISVFFHTLQIVADPRFRLAEKLHEAGLNNNPYAQQVYSKLQPIHAPRRDMESTVFNYN